ncbi:adenylate/guanylate cyclase domain-containing protein [Mycobacterium sp. SMC-4]|uniref:adenylate/guanylate cyclase domain-containing protein n=1 Tax=Mycobacterium sp. SMC-4 TaxID=2857059 RepID=UPI0021B49685|nr:adenylate/guanylate cyclase domain-containing protein [Mycobacterium sp. SMC-4]UXA18044.1 adenylate/guanylate cyclase domain-containing protein [Mycobacterium sp. SMC-4]
MTVALWIVVALQTAALTTLGVVLIVSRRQLAGARRALARRTRVDDRPHRPRRPVGVGPLAVRAVANTVQTADAIIRKGIGGQVRSSIEDLAGWARVERPDLAKITASGSVVLVFSDIEGSTERNEAMGDRAWVRLLERHNALVEGRVRAHRGYVVKNQGDGFMIAFAEPADALRCCVEIQHALSGDSERWDGIRVRIGAHVGTSVRRGEDLFGIDVAMAARIADLADGGQIMVSEALRACLDGADDLRFGEPQKVEFKGIRDAQTVYPVQR